MIFTDLGMFQEYTPVTAPAGFEGVVFYRNEAAQDFYELQGTAFSNVTGVFLVDRDETVAGYSTDVSALAPSGFRLVAVRDDDFNYDPAKTYMLENGVIVEKIITYRPLNKIQFDAILRILNTTEADIDSAIDAAMTDSTTNAIAKAKVRHSTLYRRDNPLFTLLAPIIGISEADLNTAWLVAQEII